MLELKKIDVYSLNKVHMHAHVHTHTHTESTVEDYIFHLS